MSAPSTKGTNYLSWDEYFMAAAFLAAKRSKDPRTQVGACIVDKENRIVGLGYNGFPRGCSDDVFPWTADAEGALNNKYMYVVHAEANAILNKNTADISGARIFVSLFPCNECAKLIIQSGISEVIYMSDKHADQDGTIGAKWMLDEAGIRYTKFKTNHTQITLDFCKE